MNTGRPNASAGQNIAPPSKNRITPDFQLIHPFFGCLAQDHKVDRQIQQYSGDRPRAEVAKDDRSAEVEEQVVDLRRHEEDEARQRGRSALADRVKD